jgi:hypothetical protein
MSATTGSRYRGRQTRGGRVVLRCADGCGELVLEEWELQQLLRALPQELKRAIRPGSTLRDYDVSCKVANALGAEHPAHDFFARCSAHGGFMVGRA